MGNTGKGGGGTTSGQKSRAADSFKKMLAVVKDDKKKDKEKDKEKRKKKRAKASPRKARARRG